MAKLTEEEEIKLCLANRTINYVYAKGWEFLKKKYPNMSEEELEEKLEIYVDNHKDTKFAVNSLFPSN